MERQIDYVRVIRR